MINDLVLLSIVGIQPVLVHGGGPEINIWLNKLGIEAEFKNGLRVTDGELACHGDSEWSGRLKRRCTALARARLGLLRRNPCTEHVAVLAVKRMSCRWVTVGHRASLMRPAVPSALCSFAQCCRTNSP